MLYGKYAIKPQYYLGIIKICFLEKKFFFIKDANKDFETNVYVYLFYHLIIKTPAITAYLVV